jgi:bacteriorhodopsin
METDVAHTERSSLWMWAGVTLVVGITLFGLFLVLILGLTTP